MDFELGITSPAEYLFTQPAPQGDDQAVFAHTVMAPAPSWEEGV